VLAKVRSRRVERGPWTCISVTGNSGQRPA